MSNKENSYWMLTFEPEEITSYVRTHGMLVFMNRLTESENATIAANTIQYLDKKNIELTFFMDSNVRDDESRKIEYGIVDHNPALAVVHLKKTIHNIFVTDIGPEVIVGPIVRREHALPLVDFLNSLLKKKEETLNAEDYLPSIANVLEHNVGLHNRSSEKFYEDGMRAAEKEIISVVVNHAPTIIKALRAMGE